MGQSPFAHSQNSHSMKKSQHVVPFDKFYLLGFEGIDWTGGFGSALFVNMFRTAKLKSREYNQGKMSSAFLRP